MRSLRPIILEDVTLPNFIQYIVFQHQGPSTIVVCADKETFLDDFVTAHLSKIHLKDQGESLEPAEGEALLTLATEEDSSLPSHPAWNPLALRQLAASKDIHMVFCPDISHLRAFLAAYPIREYETSEATSRLKVGHGDHCILAILNLIDLHRLTSAFSAQGLNRTIAIAVDAAHLTQKQLLIAECPITTKPIENLMTSDDTDVPVQLPPLENPWQQEVSILNITTKSFGAGERGWVGRTVKLRRVAERWCTFETIDASIHQR